MKFLLVNEEYWITEIENPHSIAVPVKYLYRQIISIKKFNYETKRAEIVGSDGLTYLRTWKVRSESDEYLKCLNDKRYTLIKETETNRSVQFEQEWISEIWAMFEYYDEKNGWEVEFTDLEAFCAFVKETNATLDATDGYYWTIKDYDFILIV